MLLLPVIIIQKQLQDETGTDFARKEKSRGRGYSLLFMYSKSFFLVMMPMKMPRSSTKGT